MKIVGPLIVVATLLFAAGARSQDAVALDKPYASIVARNMFGLVPIPTNDPAASAPPEEPPPKITPNGIMTLFGRLQALFKVAGKPNKPGQPAKDQAYVLSEGEMQDEITVLKINQPDRIITFNNHGKIEELPLVAAANTTAPAGGPGGVPGMGNPAFRPNMSSAAERAATLHSGRPVTAHGMSAGSPGTSPVQPSATQPGLGASNFQPQMNQTPPASIEDQVMNAAREMAQIEQNRIATQPLVDAGMYPPLPPTMLTPADATAHDGAPLIAPNEPVPQPTTGRGR